MTQIEDVYDSSKVSSLRSDLRSIFRNRRAIVKISIVELQNRYKKSVLGPLWSILNPLLTTAVIYFIFGGIFNGYLPGDKGYFFWVFSGFTLQMYVLTGITFTANLIISNLKLVLNYRLNPTTVTLAVAFSQAMNFLIASVAVILAAMFTGNSIGVRILLLPIFAFFTALFLSGSGMILFHYFLRYDDASYFFNVIIMIVSYLSPFLYPFDILKRPLLEIVSANPVTSLILTFRWIVIEGQDINPWRLGFVPIFCLITFLIGLKHLRIKWNETVML